MRFITPTDFRAERAWAALDIATIEGASVRLHWTDQPYRWHVNDGEEVFVVLDGAVDMHVRDAQGRSSVTRMEKGDIFHAERGTEHVAHPQETARVLVIEKSGSI